MNKPILFTGAATALVTPFSEGKVDYAAFGKLIDRQLANAIDAVVVCGTTGESATLTDGEKRDCIRFAVEKVGGRVPVIAGTGSNDTLHALSLSRDAFSLGADAVLLVTPYYNKATEKGMVASFLKIAESVKKPCILYNVPSRTACGLTVGAYRELCKSEYIVATKEASGDVGLIARVAAECGENLAIYSGNDDQILPILSLGGKGVISVLSNLLPRETHSIVEAWRIGRIGESSSLQLSLLDLISVLFSEVNPIPIKTALAAMGLCSDEMRLPLCKMDENKANALFAVMRRHGLLPES